MADNTFLKLAAGLAAVKVLLDQEKAREDIKKLSSLMGKCIDDLENMKDAQKIKERHQSIDNDQDFDSFMRGIRAEIDQAEKDQREEAEEEAERQKEKAEAHFSREDVWAIWEAEEKKIKRS